MGEKLRQPDEEAQIASEKPELETVEKSEQEKIEWGLELGQISWDEAQEKINELNNNLEEGEMQWRLPTKDELIAEFKKSDKKFRKTGLTSTGFQTGDSYWSSTEKPDDPDFAYALDMGSGIGGLKKKNEPHFSRCTR